MASNKNELPKYVLRGIYLTDHALPPLCHPVTLLANYFSLVMTGGKESLVKETSIHQFMRPGIILALAQDIAYTHAQHYLDTQYGHTHALIKFAYPNRQHTHAFYQGVLYLC